MKTFDLTKVYGFKGVKTQQGAAINFQDEDFSSQLGAKLGKGTGTGGGGEEA